MSMFLRKRPLLQNVIQIVSKRYKSEKIVKVNFHNGVQTITMCDIKTRNTLSVNMMEALIKYIKSEEKNKELRAVVLAAEGDIFSAGHNFKELAGPPETHKKIFNLASNLMFAIIDSPVPVIAKVNGLAAAGGCQLVAQCDLAVCSEKSRFSTPGANFGVFCSTPGIALARTMPKTTVLHMLFTGLPISAQEAKNRGLVVKVCSNKTIDIELDEILAGIIFKSRAVIESGKRFYYQQVGVDVKQAYEMGSVEMQKNLSLQDGQEGVKSFLAKRAPQWSDS